MSTDITGSKAGNEKVTVTVRPVRDPEKMCGSSNKNQIIRMLLEQSDRVEKNLYVNAPGVPKSTTITKLICPKSGQERKETIVFDETDDIVKGSESLSVSVIGDILGVLSKTDGSHLTRIWGPDHQE